jgi:hypothetical protein
MLEPAARRQVPGVGIRQERVLRGLDARERNRRLEHLPRRVGVDDEGPELVAEPEVAVLRAPHGLEVEVGAGQEPVGPEEGERDLAVRIAQLDVGEDVDAAAHVVLADLGVGLDRVEAQQEVAGVRLRAEAVVRHAGANGHVRGQTPDVARKDEGRVSPPLALVA